MWKRFHRTRWLFALSALGITAGCDHPPSAATAPTAVVASVTTAASVMVEPATLRAEVVSANACAGGPAFGTRLIVVISTNGILILRGLRFGFTDRGGLTSLPRVTPIHAASPFSVAVSTIPPPNPIPMPGIAPLPTTPPIPLPGSGDAAGTSQRLPFFLRFDCGVRAEGMLSVMTDVGRPSGTIETSERRVHVGF
jgi:hypothetical protein